MSGVRYKKMLCLKCDNLSTCAIRKFIDKKVPISETFLNMMKKNDILLSLRIEKCNKFEELESVKGLKKLIKEQEIEPFDPNKKQDWDSPTDKETDDYFKALKKDTKEE